VQSGGNAEDAWQHGSSCTARHVPSRLLDAMHHEPCSVCSCAKVIIPCTTPPPRALNPSQLRNPSAASHPTPCATHSLKKAEEERMRDAHEGAIREKKEKKEKKKDKDKK